MTGIVEKQEKTFVQISLRIPPNLHLSCIERMRELGLTFNGLIQHLLRRWLNGELERKDLRPISEVESEEDREILRIVHRPSTRAEELAGSTIRHYLELKKRDADSLSSE